MCATVTLAKVAMPCCLSGLNVEVSLKIREPPNLVFVVVRPENQRNPFSLQDSLTLVWSPVRQGRGRELFVERLRLELLGISEEIARDLPGISFFGASIKGGDPFSGSHQQLTLTLRHPVTSAKSSAQSLPIRADEGMKVAVPCEAHVCKHKLFRAKSKNMVVVRDKVVVGGMTHLVLAGR